MFLERDPAMVDRYRATPVGGEFARRALPPPPAELVRRILTSLCERGDAEQALETCLRLGDPAVAREVVLAIARPDLLGCVLEDVLALAASAGDDSRLAELRGDLHYLRGTWDDAVQAYADAALLGDPTVTRLARKRATLLYLRGRLDEADETCAAARLDGTDLAEESKVQSWRAAVRWMRGDVEACRSFLADALERGTAAGDDAALATVHTTRAMLAALSGDRHENADAYRVALRHAERAGDVVQIVRIRTNRASHQMEEGNYDLALRELDVAIELAELIGSDNFCALAYSNRGDTYRRLGRLDDALDDLRRAEEIWQRLGSGMVHYAVGLLGDVQALRGQRSEAISLYRHAIELADAQRDTQALVPGLDRPGAHARRRRSVRGDGVRRTGDRHGPFDVDVRRPPRGGLDRAAPRRSRRRRRGTPPSPSSSARTTRTARPSPRPCSSRRRSATLPTAPSPRSRGAWPTTSAIASARRAPRWPWPARSTRRQREDAIAAAEQLLVEAGAWGVLAEVRESRPEPEAAPVVIGTLGGFRVSRAGRPVELGEWGSRKARDLLKLLVARRGAPVVREEVAAMLWPDEPDRSARRLSVLLSTIRGVLDPGKEMPPDHYVAADHDTVWLVREHVEIDVEQFLRDAADGRQLLAAGDAAAGEEALDRAAARYLGEFCADDPYADWAAGTRELARHTFVELSGELARLADGRTEHGDAVRHRLRILDVDPYDEDAHLAMIRSLTAQRRHGEARRAYRTYCTRLTELELEPAPFP